MNCRLEAASGCLDYMDILTFEIRTVWLRLWGIRRGGIWINGVRFATRVRVSSSRDLDERVDPGKLNDLNNLFVGCCLGLFGVLSWMVIRWGALWGSHMFEKLTGTKFPSNNCPISFARGTQLPLEQETNFDWIQTKLYAWNEVPLD